MSKTVKRLFVLLQVVTLVCVAYLVLFSDLSSFVKFLLSLGFIGNTAFQYYLFKAHNKSTNTTDLSRERFFASMSHELRTPLNGIIGINTLLEETPLSGEQAQYVDMIEFSSKNLLNIVNDILNFSKSRENKILLSKEEFVLKELLDSLEKNFEMMSENKGILFDLTRSEDLPTHLLGDQTRIFQVLNNIVGNSIKFTDKGMVTLTVSYSDNALHFIITDTGIGMSEDEIDKIFNPFEQANNSIHNSFGGTGLGMSIANDLVALMDGSINIKSTPGEGSEFKIILKVESIESKSESSKILELANEEFATNFPLRILVAEDNKINAKVTMSYLKKLGYKADLAENGLEVLEAMKYKQFDFIFMDMQMPYMNGLEATQEIRKSDNEYKDIYIVALTANAFEENKRECFKAGINGFMSKPVKIADIKKFISDIYMDIKKVA